MKTERRLDFVNEVMGSEPHTLVYNYVAKIQELRSTGKLHLHAYLVSCQKI